MANIKISELNPLLTVEDADVLPIVDNGVTKKVTAAILRSYTQGNSVLLTGAQTVAGIKTFTSQLASSVATGTAPFSVASTTKVTNLNADLLDGLSSADFQATLSGTGIVKSTAGTISYLTDNTANWDTAYNDKINSAAVTGSGTNTLTLTQQDAGTITATWVNGTLIREVRNTTGATLTKGTIVYISGATGNKPTVTKAIATGDSTSAQTFGFIQSDLANNDNGYVVVVGDLTGVDTSAFAEGAQLYLSSTVAGTFTDVKQYAPAHLVYVGIVTRSHPTLGQIEVNIQNGYELDELHNVSAQSPSNGDILQFVTSTGLWTKVAGTTTNISEGTNLYFTNARSRSAISESVTGLDYNSTTGVLSTTSGYGIPTTASQATWDTAYNDSIVSAAVTGTTTKTLTLNQQDGGTVTASWTDINTDAVSSVFGRTGAVVAASGDYTTTQVTEGTNLYFTDARARAAISLTTTGTSGAATYSGGVLNIPQYQAALTNPITGTGTTNYLPKFTGTSALGNSLISESGTTISVIGNSGVNDTIFKVQQSADHTAAGIQIIANNAGGAGYNFIESSTNGVGSNWKIWGGAAANNLVIATGGTDRLIVNSSGNVGIGTTSPAQKLEVAGIVLAKDNSSYGGAFMEGFNGITYFGSLGSDNIEFYTGGATKMSIKSAGNVGIGTNDPQVELALYNASTPRFHLQNSTSGVSSVRGLQLSLSGTDGYIWNFENGATIFGTNAAERMRITSAGNVGIGSTNPSEKLSVASTDEYLLSWQRTGDSKRWAFGADSSGTFISNRTDSVLPLFIKNSGNVLIGTITDAGYKLDVNGTARVSGATSVPLNLTGEIFSGIEYTRGSTTFGYIGTENTTAGGMRYNSLAGNFEHKFYNNSNLSLTLASTGAATFSGQVNIGNPVTAAVAVASTHKVTIVIGGTTYYLLATT